jgi:heme-degrading monooxygenase HmoA
MASAIITRLKVENFETWKAAYDAGEGMRREHRVRGVTLLRDGTEPNTVLLVTRFDSIDDAKKMVGSDKWKEASKGSGAQMQEAFFANVVDERSY